MEITEIGELVKEYRKVLAKELVYKHDAQRLHALILSGAMIDGKNAEARKHQANAVLAESDEYQAAIDHAGDAENARHVAEAEIGLVKAWLYSQAPRS